MPVGHRCFERRARSNSKKRRPTATVLDIGPTSQQEASFKDENPDHGITPSLLTVFHCNSALRWAHARTHQ